MSENAPHNVNPKRMLFQFSLYGFLKNQKYFEPFMIFYLLAMTGGSFVLIGWLKFYSKLIQNLFEVPSGAIADLAGRRRCMMFSFSSYIVSFAIFGFARNLWQLFAAMTLFALGDAFRTGTHKAMIFSYLQHEGRTDEKTKYYGKTRSWSKMGSALMAPLAAVLVIAVAQFTRGTQDAALTAYRGIFLACIPLYLLQLVNFSLYPKYLDGDGGEDVSLGKIFTHLFKVLWKMIRRPSLRGLLIESAGYEGLHDTAKDFLQPVVKLFAAVTLAKMLGPKLPILEKLTEVQRTGLMIGIVYCVLHLLESVASRKSDAVRQRLGGEEQGARFLWKLNFLVFVLIAAGLGLEIYFSANVVSFLGLSVAIFGFIALAVLQNLWRPLHIGRFDTHGSAEAGATILSVEAQSKTLSAAAFWVVLGYAVDSFTDLCGAGDDSPVRFLPVALAGVAFAAGMLLFGRRPRTRPSAKSSASPQEPEGV